MSAKSYYRPIPQTGPARPDGALPLAGGWTWFSHVEVLRRGQSAEVIAAHDLPAEVAGRLTAPRAPLAGMDMRSPQIMGILNATPDSFSDGGKHAAAADAIAAGQQMVAAGVDLLDVGGESTRPGARTIDPDEETARVEPIIAGLQAAGVQVPISIDTRKAPVAQAAVAAGAKLVNDVSGFTYDPDLAPFCARAGQAVCVMHALGDPATMQDNPVYDDVVLDVFDFLQGQIAQLIDLGIPRDQILADPGIGFGKTLVHNLALLARLSLFHDLGVPILLGASRKGFIGKISGETQAENRAPGSIAVALAALAHGIQVLRVHDVAQTVQARALWQAAMTGKTE